MGRFSWFTLFISILIRNNSGKKICKIFEPEKCFGSLELNQTIGNCIEDRAYVFSQVMEGNINRVQQLIKFLRDTYKNKTAEVYVGAFDTNGKNKIYVKDDICHPVPEYIYQAVVFKNLSIVFVTLNKPLQKAYEDMSPFCEDRCEGAGIHDVEFKSFGSGYTICCTWGNIKKTFRQKQITNITLPNVEPKQRLLKGIDYNAYKFHIGDSSNISKKCVKLYQNLLQERHGVEVLPLPTSQ